MPELRHIAGNGVEHLPRCSTRRAAVRRPRAERRPAQPPFSLELRAKLAERFATNAPSERGLAGLPVVKMEQLAEYLGLEIILQPKGHKATKRTNGK